MSMINNSAAIVSGKGTSVHSFSYMTGSDDRLSRCKFEGCQIFTLIRPTQRIG